MFGSILTLSVATLLVARGASGCYRAGGSEDGCGETKTCFKIPSGCKDNNCIASVSIAESDGVFTFEAQSKGGVYVAVGLSNDTVMGADSVVECTHDVNSTEGSVNIYVSYNSGKSNNRIPSGAAQNGVTLLSGSFVDGTVHCRFTRDATTTIAGTVFDLVNQKYHLLLSVGTSLITNPVVAGLAYHDVIKGGSREARYLSEVGIFS